MQKIIVMFLLTLCFISSNVIAQNTADNRSMKCDEIIVRDKSNSVWKALDVQYAKVAEAVRKKDIDNLSAPYHKDFQVKLPNGATSNLEQTLGYLRNGFAQVKETIHTSNTILRLAVCGEDKATATVLQQWYRIQMIAGKPRRLETNAVQDEHWVKTPEGWKRIFIDEIRDGAAFLDGKRVNPTKPLDPEAPAYDPYDPKQSVADALFPIIVDKGIEAALAQYRVLKKSSDYYITEIQFNDLGYRLLGAKKVKEAIEIFKLNV